MGAGWGGGRLGIVRSGCEGTWNVPTSFKAVMGVFTSSHAEKAFNNIESKRALHPGVRWV